MQNSDITVFVIDDDLSIQRALKRLLTLVDWRVFTSSSVDEFLEMTQWPKHACVVADIRMPGMASMSLPSVLAGRGLNYPVIMLTAQDTKENRSAANKAGVAGFFRKPVDDQALIDTILWVMSDDKNRAGLKDSVEIIKN